MTTEAEFLQDVAEHEMIVLRDDGVYRHIRFKRLGTGCMHFDLVTWPGYLAYSGDMGCYVFSRLNDMFEFFRTDRRDFNHNPNGLSINLGYWSEKLQSSDCNGPYANGAVEFSEEKFGAAVIQDLVDWIREYRDDTSKEERRELWDAVMSEVIDADGDSGGYRKQCAAHDFSHHIHGGLHFQFNDFGEHNVMEYTHRFVWCCYALAWGIQKYDEEKEMVTA